MSPVAERIHRLCVILFSDIQQREAARQLGVAQPLLSRTLSGAREPSRTLIEILMDYPGVNPRWLLDGIGDPLTEGGTSLPVIKRLPKKPETRWEELEQEAERFWVSEARFSESRYWWQVTTQMLRSWGTWADKCKASAGDHLLLETDRKQIEDMSMKMQLVIASHPELKKGKPQWGMLAEKMRFIPFSREISSAKPGAPDRPFKTFRRKIKRLNKSNVVSPSDGKTNAPLSSAPDQQPITQASQQLGDKRGLVELNINQVLAVVIEMTSTTVMTP